MLNKNSMLTGMLAALTFPAIAFAAAYFLRNEVFIINKPLVPYLIAIALNLILLRICFKKDLDKTSRGIMLVTFVFMVLLFILKTHLIQ